jgi:hypothetical protein
MGSGSGSLCADTCSLAAQTGEVPCVGLPFADYGALGQCACSAGGFGAMGCGMECGQNLCKQKPATQKCLSCAMVACPVEASACFGM